MTDLPTPAEALQRLRDGNDAWAIDNETSPRRDRSRMAAVAPAQAPFATIFTCSDSRVPAELIFDQGVGDLFVVRTAGHVIDDAVMGTLHYGVRVLKTPVVVVLGHTGCGAVGAAWSAADVPQAVKAVVARIGESSCGASCVDDAVAAHVRETVRDLAESAADAAAVTFVGGVYELETGRVRWLE